MHTYQKPFECKHKLSPILALFSHFLFSQILKQCFSATRFFYHTSRQFNVYVPELFSFSCELYLLLLVFVYCNSCYCCYCSCCEMIKFLLFQSVSHGMCTFICVRVSARSQCVQKFTENRNHY